MEFFVLLRVYETVMGEEVARAQREFGPEWLKEVMTSGKVKASGALIGRRGAFLIIDADAPEDIMRLFNPKMLQYFDMKVYPTMPLARLGEVFGIQV